MEVEAGSLGAPVPQKGMLVVAGCGKGGVCRGPGEREDEWPRGPQAGRKTECPWALRRHVAEDSKIDATVFPSCHSKFGSPLAQLSVECHPPSLASVAPNVRVMVPTGSWGFPFSKFP